MKITILAIGKMKAPFLELMNEYVKRLQRKSSFVVVELEPRKKAADEGALNRQENELLKEYIRKKQPNAFMVCLDKNAKSLKSEELADWLQQRMTAGKDLLFVIGGSFGLDQELLQMAQLKLSFSDMTFPHMLFRIMLAEQLYRGFSIIGNEPYHK